MCLELFCSRGLQFAWLALAGLYKKGEWLLDIFVAPKIDYIYAKRGMLILSQSIPPFRFSRIRNMILWLIKFPALGPENKEFPTFFYPNFFTQIEKSVELGPLANFEQFWYPRTFLKKFPKVENRAKKIFTSVGVSLQVRSIQLFSTHLSRSRIDGNFLDRSSRSTPTHSRADWNFTFEGCFQMRWNQLHWPNLQTHAYRSEKLFSSIFDF